MEPSLVDTEVLQKINFRQPKKMEPPDVKKMLVTTDGKLNLNYIIGFLLLIGFAFVYYRYHCKKKILDGLIPSSLKRMDKETIIKKSKEVNNLRMQRPGSFLNIDSISSGNYL